MYETHSRAISARGVRVCVLPRVCEGAALLGRLTSTTDDAMATRTFALLFTLASNDRRPLQYSRRVDGVPTTTTNGDPTRSLRGRDDCGGRLRDAHWSLNSSLLLFVATIDRFTY